MIRIIFAIGMLLLAPTGAQASCHIGAASSPLSTMTPVGEYARKTVERVNSGLENAKAEDIFGAVFDLAGMHFLRSVESVMYMLVDTDLRSVEFSKDLTNISTCLHTDLAILEAKMEEIRCEMNDAYERKSPGAIRKLKELAVFLNDRYRHLVQGGLDPTYVDTLWPYYREFDAPFQGWCCVPDTMTCSVQTGEQCTKVAPQGVGGFSFFPTREACLAESVCFYADDGNPRPKYIEQCPFDSDYLAAGTAGFGCDATVLHTIGEKLSGNSGVAKEIEGFDELINTHDEFVEDIASLKSTTLRMDSVTEETLLTSEQRQRLAKFGEVTTDAIEHRRVFGCSADLTPEERSSLPPSPGEEENSGVQGTLTPLLRPSLQWTVIPARGAFFFRKDHLAIWKEFLRMQTEWAKKREFPSYFKNPDEFFLEKDRKAAVKREVDSLKLLQHPRNIMRDLWSTFSVRQAVQEASLLPKVQDAALQVQDVLSPIRPAMQSAVSLVSTPGEGLRKFARNYAYFLRMSCMYRPCNERLETILKILSTDECFPYASGRFRVPSNGEATGTPSWELCLDAVKKL